MWVQNFLLLNKEESCSLPLLSLSLLKVLPQNRHFLDLNSILLMS